jgi:hypothetical protein
MDYQINGIDYLTLENRIVKKQNKTYDNKSGEFEGLLKWTVFKKEPVNQKQIDELSLKMEYILNQKINGWTYDDISEANSSIASKTTKNNVLKIPDSFFRYKSLLNVDYNSV